MKIPVFARGPRGQANIVATIASVTIKGQAFGTASSIDDAFGIVAEQINKAKVGGVSLSSSKVPTPRRPRPTSSPSPPPVPAERD